MGLGEKAGVSIRATNFRSLFCILECGPSTDDDTIGMGVMEAIHQFRHYFLRYTFCFVHDWEEGTVCCGFSGNIRRE